MIYDVVTIIQFRIQTESLNLIVYTDEDIFADLYGDSGRIR